MSKRGRKHFDGNSTEYFPSRKRQKLNDGSIEPRSKQLLITDKKDDLLQTANDQQDYLPSSKRQEINEKSIKSTLKHLAVDEPIHSLLEKKQQKEETYQMESMQMKINDAESALELFPLITHFEGAIGIDNLKNTLKDAIKKSEPSDNRKIYYLTESIEKIFSMNVLQHIASLNHVQSIKTISKTFKECFILNERKELEARELIIRQAMNVTKTNKIWKVKKTDNLDEIIRRAGKGDTISLDDGDHHIRDPQDLMAGKDLQIIGNGKKSIITWNYYHCITNGSKIYFKNLVIPGGEDELRFDERSTIWIENCRLGPWNNIYGIETAASLYATNSTFISYAHQTAIYIHENNQDISIHNCAFVEQAPRSPGQYDVPTICFSPDASDINLNVLKIFGNKFENVHGCPIGYLAHVNIPSTSEIHSNKVDYAREDDTSNDLQRYLPIRH